MAFFKRRQDVAQAFRNDQQLQQFVLADVTPTGRILGTGSYGSVEEVMIQHLTCACKRIHESLINVENEGVAEVIRKYVQECQLMSSLRHPNITQFLGLCFLPGSQLPLLVMERLETSLDDLLEYMPNLPLTLKHTVLEDVASGLLYLHKRPSPIIHRDLTARKILLTPSLVAKITDTGNRIIDMRPDQMTRTLSKLPGTLVHMPPESLNCYETSFDIFSFGHLALFTLTQQFPGDLLQVQGRTELERRGKYIDTLEAEISRLHPALVQLVKQCLHNLPHQRPNTDELLTRLQRMRVEVEGKLGCGHVKVDMFKVRLAKEVKMKDRRIEEMSQQQVPLKIPLQLSWRRYPDMSFEMSVCVQSVMVQGTLYVGGGYAYMRSNHYTVMTYIFSSGKWAELSPYRAVYFAMAVINDQLVLVGGSEQGKCSKELGVWNTDSKEWTHPYPEMLTARSRCSAVVYKEWLVVAGGREDAGATLSCVEIMHTQSKQWYAAPPTPIGWAYMRTAIVEDMCYFMGGLSGTVYGTATGNMYSVSLPVLISQHNSKNSDEGSGQIWKEIPGLQVTWSTPLSIRGSLLAVGGKDKDRKAVSAIHLYQPDTEEWVKVGDLPTPRQDCTCAMITDRELLVAGGEDDDNFLKRVDITLIH